MKLEELSPERQAKIQWLQNGFAVMDSGDGVTNTFLGISVNGDVVVIGKLPKAVIP
jgi:hypothetical protein